MSASAVGTLLAGLAIIVALARLFGAFFQRIGQPPVVGEILVGVVLGPTFFGIALSNHLFPVEQVRPALGGLANVGLVLFMFIVGYELDLALVRASGRAAVAVSFGSIAAPLGLGIVLGLWLARQAEPGQPISQAEAITAIRDAAIAVSALHAAGLVHRDIKPGNIMLHEHGGKLSDLGLAHVIAPGVTVTGMGPVASIEYTDPEQLQGAPAGPATDVWSLGVTLHRAISGNGIYGEDLPADDGLLALRRVLSTPIQLAPGLPPAAAELIADATGPSAKRPSAAQFAERLAPLLTVQDAGQATAASARRS